MRRIAASTLTVLLIGLVAGYIGELFTGEVQYEEGCPVCRAIRISGKRYGFSYSRVEESPLTLWYRKNVDPLHGIDPQHPHQWQQSACTVTSRRGWGVVDYDCAWVAPLYLLSPGIELAALQQIPDRETQLGLIHSLNTSDRKASALRAKLLIEYYYVYSATEAWPDWWKRHAYEFGLGPEPVQKHTTHGTTRRSDPFLSH